MSRMESIRIAAINWVTHFEPARGRYYEYASSIYSPSEVKESEIRRELLGKGWQEIRTNTGTLVFEKDRHIIRIHSIWD